MTALPGVRVQPSGRHVLTSLRGSVRYEVRMALRGRVIWLSLVPLTLLALLLAVVSPAMGELGPKGRVGYTVIVVNTFATLGIGVFLSGRLAQHHHPALAELLNTTPSGVTTRMTGVLTGALAVAVLPLACVLALVGVFEGLRAGSPVPVAAGLLGVLVVILPAAVVITTFATLLGLLLPVALARVLVVAAWFWATHLDPGLVPLPGPTGTVLSPLGGYPAAVWLDGDGVFADRGSTGVLSPLPDSGSAVLNVVLVLVLAALFFVLARCAIELRTRQRGKETG
ncbi:hypothetical protein Q5530_07135 [Saccharothrix sp. BKS2]|uniref:hypothetical protein n=1 Tax=Saccharothrix sp. BKS2 TaxID=3064400 RepID=UPI0039EA9874